MRPAIVAAPGSEGGESGSDRLVVSTTVNCHPYVGEIPTQELLIDFLRDRLGLTGTKRSCDIEVCGSCTILVDGLGVSACTTLALEAEGAKVTTVEGMTVDDQLGDVQRLLVEADALQCGFCTPGFVMTIQSLVNEMPDATYDQVVEYLSGSICRCTGYR